MRICLGTAKENCPIETISGQPLYLEKHSWDCGWYWGFGYIGNKNLHTHIDTTLLTNFNFSDIWEKTPFTDSQWWVILDLFKQAYALKHAAKTYRHGGYLTTQEGLTTVIQDKEKEKMLNTDCEKVLNTVWDYLFFLETSK